MVMLSWRQVDLCGASLIVSSRAPMFNGCWHGHMQVHTLDQEVLLAEAALALCHRHVLLAQTLRHLAAVTRGA